MSKSKETFENEQMSEQDERQQQIDMLDYMEAPMPNVEDYFIQLTDKIS